MNLLKTVHLSCYLNSGSILTEFYLPFCRTTIKLVLCCGQIQQTFSCDWTILQVLITFKRTLVVIKCTPIRRQIQLEHYKL